MIVALCMVVALVAAPSIAQGSWDSTPPCPGVFRYAPPETESGLWAGVATLTTKFLLHSMWLDIVLDRPALGVSLLLRHWTFNATTQDNLDFRIENDDLQIIPGHPVVVRFYVRYDPQNTTSRLRTIRLNGKVICDVESLQSPQSDKYPVNSKPGNQVGDDFNSAFITPDECGVVASASESLPLIYIGFSYERGDIPWLVAIYRAVESDLLFICGGTLVSDRHVVTAAHCMQRSPVVTPVTEIVVKVGVHSLSDWSDEFSVARKLMAATIHEEFNHITLQNDILVLTLNKRVKFNRYIRPACLWSGNTELSRVVGATGVVAGWGARSVDDIRGKVDEPQMVRVPIVGTKECRASKSAFHQLTYNTTLCAGDQNGAGPCKGDSGSGLYLLEGGKWRLRGVVSVSLQSENGARTCNLNEYVVYTDAAQFLPWIRNILSQKYYD